MTDETSVDNPTPLADSRGARGRMCGYSGCRAALPEVHGRGKRALYCQDGKVWGAKNLTCKQAAQAEEDFRSLQSEHALDDTSIADLGAHIDRTLAPIETLQEYLVSLRADLDSVVSEALTERDAADARARDAEGRAQADHQRAVAAEAEAAEARTVAEQATRKATVAEEDRNEAWSETNAMRIRMEEAHTREERAEERVRDANDRVIQAEAQFATVLAEQEALQQRLNQAFAERDQAQQHAEEAKAQAQEEIQAWQEQIETARRKHAAALTEVRDDAHAQITAARDNADTAIAAARSEFEQARAAHVAQLAELHQQLGATDQQIRALADRADNAEEAQQQTSEQFQRWRHQLATTVESSTDSTAQELAHRLRGLLTTTEKP